MNIEQYISDYLVSVLENNIAGLGQNDDRAKQSVEAEMNTFFERYITGNDGDAIERCLYADDAERVFLYDGVGYTEIKENKVEYIVKQVMRRLEIGNVYQFSTPKKIANNILTIIKNLDVCAFGYERRYVIFDNCVLDLEDYSLHEHNPKYRSDIRLNFDYNPRADMGKWIGLVNQTISYDDMREAFQMFCGALIDYRGFSVEYICFLLGSGQNGKSVVTKAIANMFGNKLVSRYTPQQIFADNFSMYYRADIDGKLLNLTDDLKQVEFSSGEMKEVISGNTQLPARKPGKEAFSMRRIPKFMCNANKMPSTTDDTEGYHRRILPIVCGSYIREEDKDPDLLNKMSVPEVKQAIFNWILDGYKMLVENNGRIKIGVNIKEAGERLKADNNSVRRWVSHSRFTPMLPPSDRYARCWKSFSDLRKEYLTYCTEFDEPKKGMNSVGMVLQDLFVYEKRRDTTWYCIGTEGENKTATKEEIRAYMAGNTPLTQKKPVVEEEEEIEDDKLPF